ncbi:zinc transport system substrate-binding protein [Rhodobacteraceae bacterium MBR-64]
MSRHTLLAPVLLCLMLPICANTAFARTPQVVADIPAVGSLVEQVMGDIGTPKVLLTAGADAHSFQLRPTQAADLAGADLVFWVGPGLTPWLERAIEGVGLRGEAVALLASDGVHLRGFDGDSHGQDDAHDHAHSHAHGDEHPGEGVDPHAWLDPANAAVWVDAIAAHLSETDPEHAAAYAANAAAAKARIAAMDAEIATTLAGLGAVPLIVFHDAYGYFADHFGLTIAGAITLGDAARPGAARIAAIREVLIETGARCIFPEAQHDPALVQTVAEGTGATIAAPLDPTGSALAFGPDHYGDLMRGLAETIARCARPAI